MPLLRTPLVSSVAIDQIQKYLELQLAPTTSIHGVLMDVLGVGVLLLGKSGIGKTEAALDLVMRGHRLVADDLVEMRRTSGNMLVGWAPSSSSTTWRSAASASSTSRTCSASRPCATRRRSSWWSSSFAGTRARAYDRLGLDEMVYPILDVQVPLLRIPVRPGRNVSSLIEVAARNRLLQVRGHHSAREFQERLNRALADARERRWRDDVE